MLFRSALAQARIININSGSAAEGRGAAGGATDQITGVIQTLLATQLMRSELSGVDLGGGHGIARVPAVPDAQPTNGAYPPVLDGTGVAMVKRKV